MRTLSEPKNRRDLQGRALFTGGDYRRELSAAARVASNRNHTRRSVSSIKFSRMLADATSSCLSQSSWHSRIDAATCLLDRKSTRLNSSHPSISYAVFCLKKK